MTTLYVACAALMLVGLGCDEKKPGPDPAQTSTAKSTATTKATAAKSAQPATSAAATAAPAKAAVREVPAKEWTPKVGPKLPTGAVVAHKVFEGWPNEKSLFVVTKEKGGFKARVMDDRSYATGPFGLTGKEPHSVNAVSFFDVDGDGKTDAVIVATFGEKDDTAKYNALLKWTGTSLEQMTALEKKLGVQETIADIKKKAAGK